MSAVEYDIVIVGGGLVGASLACALSPLGYSVAVVEAVEPRAASQPSYDDRTLALGAASVAILKGLGLWSALAPSATAIGQVLVTESGQPWRVNLDAAESGRQAFGYVVEARAFGAAVLESLAGLAAVEMICPATVSDLQATADSTMLSLETGAGKRTLSARLVVGADGANSSVRGLLSIGARQKDYGQTAIICNVTPTLAHQGRAYEQLTPTGPFAVLPHVGERCGLVWCVPDERAEQILALDDAAFLEQANQRSDHDLGDFVKVGKRSSYPLKLVVPERDTDQRVVILGNAAHAIHPAGAQGFNLGLRDVACLAELLADHSQAGCLADPGDAHIIQAYSEWRKPDQQAVVSFTDALVSGFASPLVPIRALRGASLLAHSLAAPLRRRMASHAMGFRGRMPRLAMGESLSPGGADTP